MERKHYVIVYRLRGTENFKWQAGLPMFKDEADRALAAEKRAGRYSSFIMNYDEYEVKGLPTTFEGHSRR